MGRDDTDWLDVDVSDTARQKGFRYLKGFQMEQHVYNATPPIYYDEIYDNWHMIVDEDEPGNSTGQPIHLLVGINDKPDRKTAVVATQTSDHYDYDDWRFTKVHRIGEYPE